ncbi:tetratricopeptide repeat protein [Candidatus Poribacteria bacterium]|nr:tetratricopeptide repeat protein [Candidatus Poribacteria bacterium]MYA58176.1 tetratricopeptide repeat protein [Candidatus Poribacteria bacterium]
MKPALLRRKVKLKTLILAAILLCLTPSLSRTETTAAFPQGVEYVKLRLYPQAVDTFKSILSRDPTDVNALFQLANVYKLQDKLELAIQTFNTLLTQLANRNFTITNSKNALTIERIHGLTHLALSEIYCKQSKLDTAEQHAKEAVQRCPTDADTHYRLGYIYTHQAKFDPALTSFQDTLAHNPNFAEVYEWLGLIALMQQKPQQAVEHYQQAIKRKPYVQSAYYNLAKAYRLLGDTAAATEQLKLFQQMKTYYDRTYAIEGALAEDPLNTALRLELAEIHLTHKHISAAITTYQSLIRLNPASVTGYDKLGRLYMDLNMPQRAIPFFLKVIERNPNAVEAHVRLGWLYTTLKAFDKAELHLQTAIEKMPGLTLAYHGLAEIYTKQGHLQKAIDVYRHITEIAPDDDDARKALQNLEHLKKRF